ncbi:hypothetical protein BKA63DRAFT_482752 [Paraphoma chrysanthemicola]|nr:hypothetical protein BKA63DRAFT_482752 [Paraphoma chrysanthemicola]
MENIHAALQNLLPASIIAELPAKLEPTGTLIRAIRDILNNHPNDLALDLKEKLSLTDTFLARYNAPLQVLPPILLESKARTVSDAISCFWETWQADISTRVFAEKLFNDESSAVVKALVTSGRFSIEPTLRSDVLDVFETMEPNFDLLRQPLLESNPAFDVVQKLDFTRKKHVFELLASIQQICQVVIEPLQLPILISLGFKSPEQIAYAPRQAFITSMTKHGVSEAHAQRIHGEAISVQIKQEQAWMAVIQQQHSDTTTPPVFRLGTGTTDQNDPLAQQPPGQTNLAGWFGDLEQVSCLDCCSVTSPAAYFVDLLRMLKNVPDPASSQVFGPRPTSLLDQLFKRRPDLGNLLLSCRNTKEMVPYIDLVNEALESTVAYIGDKSSINSQLSLEVYNADAVPEETIGTRLPRSPVNIKTDVYDRFISKSVYPSNIFPYNLSLDSLRQYLAASKTGMTEALRVFRADVRFAGSSKLSDLIRNSNTLDNVHDRWHAAETLGMTKTDYVALTHESFLDRRSAMLATASKFSTQKEYEEWAGLRFPSDYWGYGGEAGVDDMLDTTKGNGISFIKKELLPRLAINFTTLVELLKTNFLGRRLAISPLPEKTMLPPNGNVPTDLGSFRLKHVDGQLDEDTCHKLEQFVRLWRRIGWSIETTDDAISAFSKQAEGSPAVERTNSSITPNCIEQLAAVSQIAAAAKVDPKRVISMFFPSARHLLKLPIVQSLISSAGGHADQIFAVPQPALSYSTYTPLLLASVDLSYDEMLVIQKSEALGIGLTVQDIFAYYRACEATHMFGMTYEQLADFLAIMCTEEPAFSSPKFLLRALEKWKKLEDDGWKIADVLKVCQSFGIKHGTEVLDTTAKFASDVLRDMAASQSALSFVTHPADSGKGTNVTQSAALRQAIGSAARSIAPGLPLAYVQHLLQLDSGQQTSYEDQLTLILNGPGNVDLYSDGFIGAIFCSADTTMDFEASVTGSKSVVLQFQRDLITLVPKQVGTSFKVTCKLNIAKDTVSLLSWPPGTKVTEVTFFLVDGKVLEDPPRILSQNSLLDIQYLVTQLGSCSHVLERYPLSIQELSMLAKMYSIDTGPKMIEVAEKYAYLRRSLAKGKGQGQFARFFESLQSPADAFREDLSTQFREATVMSKSCAEKLLKGNFPTLDGDSLRVQLRSLRTMETLARQVQFLRHTGLKDDAIELLFKIAEPFDSGQTVGSTSGEVKGPLTDLVQHIRSSMISRGFTSSIQSTQDILRERRRQALLQYLIQNPAIRELGIVDADGLFEYFLIDVQMGCGLDTTRIKQAISTVQLFVYRCLLGLEKGAQASLIDRNRWQWMQKYTLWEANRKVFLYPENWAEPSLRESKTSLFKSIEEAIMQTNLDDQSIRGILRSYVCGADEIANLSVEAFFWDVSTNADKTFTQGGSFHLFARTRNMPFQYYYRRMDYLGSNSLPSTTWTPWEKLPFDIAANSSDSAGASIPDPGVYIVPVVWRGRLIVFLPQLSISAPPVTNSAGNSSSKVSMTQRKEGGMELDLASVQQNVKRNIEIKMSWSEFIDGQWLPQKQTPEVITATSSTTEPPAFNSFRFAADPTQAELGIFAFRVNASSGSSAELADVNCIGKFVLQGPRLALLPPSALTPAIRFQGNNSPNTNFGRLKLPAGGDVKLWPALSRPPISTNRTIKSITWTLDANARQDNAAGLVADAAVGDGLGFEPWFTLPKARGETFDSTKTDDVDSVPLYNGLAEAFKAAITTGDGLDSIYQVMDQLSIKRRADKDVGSYDYAFGSWKFAKRCIEDATPYAIYNWELGFHIVSLLTERLIDLQQFEMALKYARLVFDPAGKADATPPQRPVWRFPPFRDPDTRSSGTLNTVMDNLKTSSGADSSMNPAVLAWRRNPFKPHAVAAGRPLAYMKRFVMKYIEALIAVGDNLFRQNSLESLPMAIQHYVEASQVFGPTPQIIPELGDKSFKSFNDLNSVIDDFSNALVDLRLTFPYFVPLDQRGRTTGGSQGLQGFTKTRYFGIQANPEFIALRRLVDDRLVKIRGGLDINGNPRTLALWDPPIDVRSAVLAASSGGGGGLGMILSGSSKAVPRIRFQYLMQRALEVCAELKQSGAALLSVAERKDGEEFQSFRAKQETGLPRILIGMKKKQKVESEKGLEQLQLSRNSAVHRLLYYASLTGDDVKVPGADADFEEITQNIPKPSNDDLRLTVHEQLELGFADQAAALNTRAYGLELSSAILSIVPMPEIDAEPFGYGMSFQMPSLGIFNQIGALTLRGLAASTADAGQRSARISGWTKQLQERRLEQNQTGQEIKNIDKQMEAARIRIEVIEKDIAASEKALDDALATEEFLRSKFTSEALYAWYESNARSYHYQLYIMATELAKRVEAAYIFEMGPIPRSFLSPSGYWDQTKRGLQSGDQLWFALKRMESDYVNQSATDFELSKNISLRQLDPVQLLGLRENATAKFKLPELVFDLDFPGHYCRRIKSVAFSLQCIAGPYTSISCTASLQNHRFRNDPKPGPKYFEQAERDERFIGQDFEMPITAIALSHGTQDSGTFELNFNSEQYQPFEGAGAISEWLLTLPNKVRQFDYSTISDVVMHLRYTSKSGGETLRTRVEDDVAALLKQSEGNYTALLDIRNEAPNAWHDMSAAILSATNSRILAIPDIRERLPYFTKALRVSVTSLEVYIRGMGTSNVTISASKSIDGTNAMRLNATDTLGTLQSFKPQREDNSKIVDPKEIDRLCSAGIPWYLGFNFTDDKAIVLPTDVLVMFEYQLASM